MLKRELPFIADPKGLAWRDSSSQVLKCDCEEGSCVMGVGRQVEARHRTYRDSILPVTAKARVSVDMFAPVSRNLPAGGFVGGRGSASTEAEA